MALTPSEHDEKVSTLSSGVDLSTYSESNKYIPDTDGYLYVYNTNAQTGFMRMYRQGYASIGGAAGRFATFVRKGTPIYPDGTMYYCYFYPINY